MNNEKKFNKPEAEIIDFSNEDIITKSVGGIDDETIEDL